MVSHGLRATLQSANLLTGQMLVALDFMSNAPPATVTTTGRCCGLSLIGVASPHRPDHRS